jgi:acetyl-CoA carboxylase biotin carboxyl carrier protein
MRNQKTKDPDSHISVDWRELERLLKFMEEHGLEEFEYSRGDFRVRLRKPGAAVASHADAPAVKLDTQRSESRGASGRGSGAVDKGAASRDAVRPEAGSEMPDEDQSDGAQLVKSPIVGTYYEAPNPGAPAFVKVGDHVSAGQVICIVEAMKLMNEIESDVGGKVTKIFMQNGQPVEYGQPLFAIQPANQA